MQANHDPKPIERARNRSVEETLAAQRRVISRTQAVAAGLSRSQIDQLVRGHTWKRARYGIYTDADPTCDDVRVWSAWLWAGRGAVLGAQAALYWAGLAERAPDTIDLYLPAARSRQKQEDLAYRRGRLDPRDTLWHYGLRVTTPARSSLDLARWGNGDCDGFLEVVLRRGADGGEGLRRVLTRCRGLHGYERSAAAVERVATNPWSVPEAVLHRALEQRGVSGWVANRRLDTIHGEVFPDVAFHALKLAVEIDGRRYHAESADPAAFERSARRRQRLVDEGWTVLHFTAKQILEDVESVVTTILGVITRLTVVAV